MKKLFLVGLMMLSGSAWAEWVMFNESEKIQHFYDPATIRTDGNMRRVWQLVDNKKRNKDGVMSLRARLEYDCKQERYRVLSISTHSEPMANGNILTTVSQSNDWEEIAPNTSSETMLKIVCAK